MIVHGTFRKCLGRAALLVAMAALCAEARAAPQSVSVAGSAAATASDRKLLDQYCVGCHNARLKTGGLSLEARDSDIATAGAHADLWERVARKLRSRQMPPAGLPRPDRASSDAFLSRLEDALDKAAAAAPNPGRPTVHRLNRTEYANSIHDLLTLDIDGRALLPADDTDQHGFDNNSEVLSISPALLERYLSAARKVSRLALGRLTAPAIDTYEISKLLMQDDRSSEGLPFGSRGGIVITHYFPTDGEYSFKIRLQKTLYSAVRGLADPNTLEVRLDRERIKNFTVGGAKVVPPPASFAGTISWNPDWEKYASQADAGLEFRLRVKAGTRTVGVSFVKQSWEPEGVLQPRRTGWGYETDEMYDSNPGVEGLTIEGPFAAPGAGDTPSRRRIFVCQPKATGEERACAKTVLTTLAHRAYRRPLTPADIDTLLGFYDSGRREGSFETGIEMALERVLVSPDFLFRIELDPNNVVAGKPYQITEVELASRLSFFLWSGPPDDELLAAAEHGRLRKPGELERQLKRMLADPRSSALVENFAAQWLQLGDIRNAIPDPDLYPEFDENLREAFRRETELFLESQIREDSGVMELLSANYTFVNERLARHYGIPNIYGSRYRRVTLENPERRGGLLGQGSILTLTSYPNRTSPVLRGKWLLENILGTPPPPPPPVPALPDKGPDGQLQSVRERLEEHRKNPACASCHAQMDPLGFALENFDAIGTWRAKDEAGSPINASGSLAGAPEFRGLAGLRTLLLDRREQFADTVAERLLSFALGRGVEYYDRPALRKITRDAKSHDYRWSTLILEIIQSVPFQMRRAES
jgi:mono/diheme cytochrome c family protein